MQLHNITSSKGTTAARRIGRGGKRGKTSGRGHKGQKSRAGHKIRPAERDTIKRIPKRRGYGKNRARTVNSDRTRPATVNLCDLEASFASGDRVDPKVLHAKKLVRAGAAVKILGLGTLTKKLSISGCELSAHAKESIEKAGGNVLA